MTMYAYHKDGSEHFALWGHLIEVEEESSTHFKTTGGNYCLLGEEQCAHLNWTGSWILVDLPKEMT